MAKNRPTEKTRFNVFDLLIILIVIACIVALVLRIYVFNKNALDKKVNVSFSVNNVMETTAEKMNSSIKNGTVVYLTSNNEVIGYVTSIDTERSTVYVEDENGNPIEVFHPTNWNVTGTAVLYGTSGDLGFYINGTQRAEINSVVSVYTDTVQFEMTLTDISAPTARN